MITEAELIAVLAARGVRRPDVLLGIGDDAAAIAVPEGRALVLAVDTLVEDVHFPAGIAAADLGFRALAVNLSDLAAMGAIPAWATLSLSLPGAAAGWVQEFARGFHELAQRHDVALVGGDTVRGPLVVTVQLAGHADPGRLLRRDGARAGDHVYVTGALGDAAAGLVALRDERRRGGAVDELIERFLRPAPRVALGRALAGCASAAIDLSDGLAIDLNRLADASGVGVEIAADAVPISAANLTESGQAAARRFAWTGGDDYELLFTASPEQAEIIQRFEGETSCKISRIGRVVDPPGVWRLRGARREQVVSRGFDHFAAPDD